MIRQETIQKTALFLNDINKCLKAKSHISTKEVDIIAKKNSVANDLFYVAVKIGVFEKVDRGIYKPKYSHIEPIHARKVVETRNSNYSPVAHKKSMRIKRNKEGKQLVIKQLPNDIHRFDVRGKDVNTNNVAQEKKHSNTKKSLSILWGLLKIQY